MSARILASAAKQRMLMRTTWWRIMKSTQYNLISLFTRTYFSVPVCEACNYLSKALLSSRACTAKHTFCACSCGL